MLNYFKNAEKEDYRRKKVMAIPVLLYGSES
jgi:hypothetical protein